MFYNFVIMINYSQIFYDFTRIVIWLDHQDNHKDIYLFYKYQILNRLQFQKILIVYYQFKKIQYIINLQQKLQTILQFTEYNMNHIILNNQTTHYNIITQKLTQFLSIQSRSNHSIHQYLLQSQSTYTNINSTIKTLLITKQNHLIFEIQDQDLKFVNLYNSDFVQNLLQEISNLSEQFDGFLGQLKHFLNTDRNETQKQEDQTNQNQKSKKNIKQLKKVICIRWSIFKSDFNLQSYQKFKEISKNLINKLKQIVMNSKSREPYLGILEFSKFISKQILNKQSNFA